MDDVQPRAQAIHAWAKAYYRAHPNAPDLAPSEPFAIPLPPGLVPLLQPTTTVLLSPGATYVFHLRGILLARGVGRRLPERRLRWQHDTEIQALLARAGGADPEDDLLLAPDPTLSAHLRLRAAALDPPVRTLGKILLRRPGIVGLLGIEAQEIRLLALRLDDASWGNGPIS